MTKGHLLGFNVMKCRYRLGPHHLVIWNQVTELVLFLEHIRPLDGDHKIQDWMLQKGNIVIPRHKITTHSVYRLLQHASWCQEHANALWHLVHKNIVLVEKQAYGLMEL